MVVGGGGVMLGQVRVGVGVGGGGGGGGGGGIAGGCWGGWAPAAQGCAIKGLI